jgi:hypothetical protein
MAIRKRRSQVVMSPEEVAAYYERLAQVRADVEQAAGDNHSGEENAPIAA